MTDTQTANKSMRSVLLLCAVAFFLLIAVYFFFFQGESPEKRIVDAESSQTKTEEPAREAATNSGNDKTDVTTGSESPMGADEDATVAIPDASKSPSSGQPTNDQQVDSTLSTSKDQDNAELLANVEKISQEAKAGTLPGGREPSDDNQESQTTASMAAQESPRQASDQDDLVAAAERILQETIPTGDGAQEGPQQAIQPLASEQQEVAALAVSREIQNGAPAAIIKPDEVETEAGTDTTSSDSTLAKSLKPPTFDTVRIDRFGTTLISGRAEPNSVVHAIVNGDVKHQHDVGGQGQFAMIFEIDATNQPALELTLKTVTSNGQEILSEQTVVVLQSELQSIGTATEGGSEITPTDMLDLSAQAIQASQPTVLLSSLDGIKVLQQGLPVFDHQTLVELITYDETGEAIVSGRAKNLDGFVRIYIDNQYIKDAAIQSDKSWSSNLAEIEPGRYVLRVDEVNSAGRVVNRVEMLLQKEGEDFVKEMIAAASAPDFEETGVDVQPLTQLITVQRGYTLWGISRNQFGLGRLFVNIFELNKDQIRDPDLIYPGQIFQIPKSDELFDPEFNRKFVAQTATE